HEPPPGRCVPVPKGRVARRFLGSRAAGARTGHTEARHEGVVPATVTASDFLGRLDAATAAEFERLGSRRRFPAGSMLFLEGDPASEAYVLLDGAVKITVGSTDGREVVLDVVEPRCLLGELSLIDGRPRS